MAWLWFGWAVTKIHIQYTLPIMSALIIPFFWLEAPTVHRSKARPPWHGIKRIDWEEGKVEGISKEDRSPVYSVLQLMMIASMTLLPLIWSF